MRPHLSLLFRSLLFTLLLLLAPAATPQTLSTARPVERIRTAIDDRDTISRPGNVHPLAQAQFDRGLAPAQTRMDRMLLALQPDAQQVKALDALLEQQQDPASPEYHRWLTPEEFGRMFGVADHDLALIVDWLEGYGFRVEPLAPAHREIVFSGTAAQVSSAFQTEIHIYEIEGRRHFANAADPRIPRALAGVVEGVVSLHDFLSEPQHHLAGPDLSGPAAAAPEFNSGGSHYLAPADFATIYDVVALYSQSIDGTGQTLAVLGRTDIKLTDVQTFRSQFGLPANEPAIILNGPDPGVISVNEQVEATLDVEWAGAVAEKATVDFVVSASTNASDGVALSAEYAVNHAVAPVVSLSFGSCEAAIGASGNQFWNSLWQQAAAQGMTVLVSAGDSGAAGCDGPSASSALQGDAVNGLCSSPFSTCVGGTQFSDTANPNAYWSATANASSQGSALSYIPEAVWNQSGSVAGGSGLWAGGGGASVIYSKPSWQSGLGVPSDGRRDVPDVALASSGHDGYLIVLNGKLNVVGGTSCATPATAGLLTLVIQKTGSHEGNANPRLYALASQQAAAGPAVFHDVLAGNNSVPGVAGFSAGAGYDLATGLGSVDATLLVNNWNGPAVSTPALSLDVNPQSLSLAQGASVNIALTTTSSGGFNSAVTLSAGALPAGVAASFSSSSIASPGTGSVTLKLTASPGLASGSYHLSIVAAGGGISSTAPLAVTISPNCQYAVNPASASDPAGAATYSASVTAQTGCTWSASTSATWITLASASAGSGSGSFRFSLAANTAAAPRTGTIAVAGVTLAITQAAAPAPIFSLNPGSASAPAAGATLSVAVAANSANPAATSWTAASNVTWMAIVKGASGSGAGNVTYAVAPNTLASARTGTLTIAGLFFTVSQAAAATAPVAACSYQIAMGPITPVSQGYAGTISVTTASGCQWSASSNQPWFAISSGMTGKGNGTLFYMAAFNTTASPRTASLTVAGYTVNFTEGSGSSGAAVTPVQNP